LALSLALADFQITLWNRNVEKAEDLAADIDVLVCRAPRERAQISDSAVLDVIETEDLPENARVVGSHLRKGIAWLGHPRVVDVRGPGLFIGVELTGPEIANMVVNDLRRHGILVAIAGPDANVLKIRPPLVFTKQHGDLVIAALGNSLSNT
jgi:4-aminobutyrate aminotransferase-like enzyme